MTDENPNKKKPEPRAPGCKSKRGPNNMNDGVPLKMVSDRLGHSSIQNTADVYGVTDDHRHREVSERLERLFRSGKNG